MGKATNIKSRALSYFRKSSPAWPRPIEDNIDEVSSIDAIKTATVIEALILEAECIKKYWPPYNVLGKDSKSFLHVAITRDEFPKVLLVRGEDLEKTAQRYCATFGPYTQARAVRDALHIIRNIFHYSNCTPPREGAPPRACFYYHLGVCPGVCIGAITRNDYKKIIRRVIQFFQGKRKDIIKELTRDMKAASRAQDFESAASARNQMRALTHIQDIALITSRSDDERATGGINIFGRIEGYDIANIQGKYAVGAMVVFDHGQPQKSQYKRFKIKTVDGQNDVASMAEVVCRRFGHPEWGAPQLLLIDGGVPQVHAVCKVLKKFHITVPVVGIAKGPSRKKIEFVYGAHTSAAREKLADVTRLYSPMLVMIRDESHRFARRYYHLLHKKAMMAG